MCPRIVQCNEPPPFATDRNVRPIVQMQMSLFFVPLRFCCYCCDCQLKLESRDCAKCHDPTEHTNVQDASMDATMPYGIGSRLKTGPSQTGQLPGRTKEVNCVS